MQEYIKTGIGFIVAIGIIALFTHWVGWNDIIVGLTHAELRYVVLAAFIGFFGLTLLGVSWWIAVKDVIDMPLLDGVTLFYVTFFANSVTPLGQFGGEPFIAYIVSTDADISIDESLGAIVVADIINAIPFFTMSLAGIAIFLLFSPQSVVTVLQNGSIIGTTLKIVTALAIVAAATALFIISNRSRVLAVLGYLGGATDRVARTLHIKSFNVVRDIDRDALVARGERFFAIAGSQLQDRRMLLKASIVAHIQAVLTPVALYIFLLSLDQAFHPGIDIPFSALLFIVPAAMLAGYLPLPGGLGGIEVAMAGLLVAITDIPAAAASAAVLLLRLSTFWAGLLLGGYLGSQMSVDLLATQFDTD
jgi:uncharacterized protein (TIRG00374 family)